jgi:hypothetical protein
MKSRFCGLVFGMVAMLSVMSAFGASTHEGDNTQEPKTERPKAPFPGTVKEKEALYKSDRAQRIGWNEDLVTNASWIAHCQEVGEMRNDQNDSSMSVIHFYDRGNSNQVYMSELGGVDRKDATPQYLREDRSQAPAATWSLPGEELGERDQVLDETAKKNSTEGSLLFFQRTNKYVRRFKKIKKDDGHYALVSQESEINS